MEMGQYNIQALRGLSSNRSLLSGQSGGLVDLWTDQDSSEPVADGQQGGLPPRKGQALSSPDVLKQPAGPTERLQKWDVNMIDSGFFNIKASGGTGDPDRQFLTFDESGVVRLGVQPQNFIGLVWTLARVTTAPEIPAYYAIAPAWWDGVTGLLSCSPDGTIVNIAPQDDGSGRQRWQFQGPPLANPFFAG